MVGIYFQTQRLPVRSLADSAATALAGVLSIGIKEVSDMHMISPMAAILNLSLSGLVLGVGSARFSELDAVVN